MKLVVLVPLITPVLGKYKRELTKITLMISFGSNIQCNCDDQLTKLTDDNILMSKDQLPVTGKVFFLIHIIQ